ncbi:MAG: hypothetical protein IT371_27335 [Deltaproteobacteria bacterium]|nr:hypothetical protein [Deltaproteobacteria bacterium]
MGSVVAPQRVRVFFREGKAFAREGRREWALAEVGRDEMLWAPDGQRFAYVKAKPRRDVEGGAFSFVVVRNLRGDSVNEFPVYRPGQPSELEWIDDDQISYVAPPDKSGDAYVVHSVSTGEVVRVLRGRSFVWSPGRKRLAYVSNDTRRPIIKVDDHIVWPRGSTTAARKRQLISPLSWSPDGSGLAFLERDGKEARLVVLLVVDNHEGDLTWPLPKGANGGENKLFWAQNKVLIGESAFKPRFAASWNRVQ